MIKTNNLIQIKAYYCDKCQESHTIDTKDCEDCMNGNKCPGFHPDDNGDCEHFVRIRRPKL